jgi:hypothetical protein
MVGHQSDFENITLINGRNIENKTCPNNGITFKTKN